MVKKRSRGDAYAISKSHTAIVDMIDLDSRADFLSHACGGTIAGLQEAGGSIGDGGWEALRCNAKDDRCGVRG